MNRFQKLALATAAATIVLFAVGGLVRGTGSGLGCSTWPECTPGRLFPAGTVHSLIEFSHRFLVFVVSVLVVATAVVAWRQYRNVPSLVWPAAAAIPLVFGQAVLGGIVVHTDLNPWWVTAHFAVALAFVADVIYVATDSFCVAKLPEQGGDGRGGDTAFARLTLITTGAAGALLLVGTYVRARSAGLAFTDWPLMNGRLVPALGGAATAMFVHRVLAAGVFLLVLWVAIRARTMAVRSKDLVVLSTLALCLFVGQIISGAMNVWSRLRPWAVVLHVALSVLIWATLVALATVSRRLAVHAGPLGEPSDPNGDNDAGRRRLAPRHDHRLRAPHEAADHRAPPDHDGARDDPCRTGDTVGRAVARHAARRHGRRRDPRTRSTCTSTATSTRSCGGRGAGRCRRTPSRPIAPCGSGSCWAPRPTSSCRSR